MQGGSKTADSRRRCPTPSTHPHKRTITSLSLPRPGPGPTLQTGQATKLDVSPQRSVPQWTEIIAPNPHRSRRRRRRNGTSSSSSCCCCYFFSIPPSPPSSSSSSSFLVRGLLVRSFVEFHFFVALLLSWCPLFPFFLVFFVQTSPPPPPPFRDCTQL